MKETSWEYKGKTVEEATQTALEELGLERDDVHIEILEEPQKGFLGLGGKEARITVEMLGEWEVTGRKESTPAPAVPIDEKEPVESAETSEPMPLESTGKPTMMVNDILEIMGIEAMVEAREREDLVIVDIWGEDVAILIGKGGLTLDALQYLVNIGCRRNDEVTKRIVVDIEGYRKRRKVKLEKEAEQMASKAISLKKSVELQPMSASERKVVHMSLRSRDGVWTESNGEGAERRVVIHPGSENPNVPRET